MCLCAWLGLESSLSLRYLPIQTFLWFYDSMLPLPPPPEASTMPRTWNKPLCDISPRAKYNVGNGSAVGTTLADTLEVTSPHSLQLTCVSDSNDSALHPHPTGCLWVCTWQLWVSSPRFCGEAQARLRGAPENACLPPVAIPQLPKTWVGASVYHQHPGCWHNLSTGLKQKQADRCMAQTVPWPCCLCNQSLVGREAG